MDTYSNYYLDECKGFKRGDVVRMTPTYNAFSDCVILGFNEAGYAKMARPYLYASHIGNTPLTGVETIAMVSIASLEAHYTKVGDGRVI